MDDGEVEFPLSSSSMDSFFDELLRDSHACTHTHTCNPPGPENTHTHTCLHVHTKILPSSQTQDDTSESSGNKSNSKKRPLGNREAVRKYREKKKAKAASLEDEVMRLRAVNSQLMKRLQGQAALEAEVTRLKCLLVDVRGRIEGEIGAFPYQKPQQHFSYAMQPCNNMPCGVDNNGLYCFRDGNSGEGGLVNGEGCEFDQLQCLGGDENLAGCSNGNGTFGVNGNKRKGGSCAAKAV